MNNALLGKQTLLITYFKILGGDMVIMKEKGVE